MRLELRVSGGVAGLRRPPVEVDTGDRADGPELEALADRVRATPPPAVPPGPDRFQYELVVDTHTVRLHEGALSDDARELVQRLQARDD
jgi:hypothetical protein